MIEFAVYFLSVWKVLGGSVLSSDIKWSVHDLILGVLCLKIWWPDNFSVNTRPGAIVRSMVLIISVRFVNYD